MMICFWLRNAPANIVDPLTLTATAADMAKQLGLSAKILDQKEPSSKGATGSCMASVSQLTSASLQANNLLGSPWIPLVSNVFRSPLLGSRSKIPLLDPPWLLHQTSFKIMRHLCRFGRTIAGWRFLRMFILIPFVQPLSDDF